MKTITRSALLAGLLTVFLTPLDAGEPFAIPLEDRSNNGDWEFTLGVFGWFTAVDGETGSAGATAPVDIGFGDILDNLDMTILASGEVHRGRWSLLADLTYLDLSASAGGGGPYFDRVSLDMEQTIATLRLAYRLIEGRTDIDVMAGARYMSVKTDLDFRGGLLDGARESESPSWIDPLIGVRLSHEFNEKWVGDFRADIGGFGVSSDLIWELFAGIGYRITDTALLYGGYRYLNVDYDRSYVFDVEIQGIMLGLDFRF